MWFCCKSIYEHIMDWFGINWQGGDWAHYMDHFPIMVYKTFNCPYFPIVLYFHMPLWNVQSIFFNMLWNSLENKIQTFTSQPNVIMRCSEKGSYPMFIGTFLTFWVPTYFTSVINGRFRSLFWLEGSLLGSNRGEYLSHKIWNYLSANMGFSATVWNCAQSEYLNCIRNALTVYQRNFCLRNTEQWNTIVYHQPPIECEICFSRRGLYP